MSETNRGRRASLLALASIIGATVGVTTAADAQERKAGGNKQDFSFGRPAGEGCSPQGGGAEVNSWSWGASQGGSTAAPGGGEAVQGKTTMTDVIISNQSKHGPVSNQFKQGAVSRQFKQGAPGPTSVQGKQGC